MNDFSIGDLVYLIRRLEGLNQIDFAKSLNIDQSTVSKLERSFLEEVPFKTVCLISKKYNIPIRCFQTLSFQVRTKKLLARIMPDSFYKEGVYSHIQILRLFNDLNEEEIFEISKQIKFKKQFLIISNLKYTEFFINSLRLVLKKDLKVPCIISYDKDAHH